MKNFISIVYKLIFLISFIKISVNAQNQEWIVFNSANSILPSNYVTSIAEDLEGNIWIGTVKGLVSNNKNGWFIFNTSNSDLPSNHIESIAVDSNNVIWMGFHDAGIVKYYNNIMEQFTTLNSNLPSNWVTQITVDKINRKWVSSHLGRGIGGVLVIDDTSFIAYTEENSELPVGKVISIDIDDSLNAWIGIRYSLEPVLGGLAKFDGTNWEFFDYDTPGFSGNYINYVEAENDSIWVATDWGLSKYNGQEWYTYLEENSGLPYNIVNTVLTDSDGIKWIGVGRSRFDRKGALVKFANESFTKFDTTNTPILPGFVTSIFIDSHRNKWIAITPYWDFDNSTSYGGGLAVYNENGVVVSVDDNDNEVIFNKFSLSENYPNPFNPTTTISYSIPQDGFVELMVFNILGKEIATLVGQYKSAGIYNAKFNGTRLASGVYIYSLRFGNKTISKKMLLLK